MKPLAVLYHSLESPSQIPTMLTVAGGISGAMWPVNNEKKFRRQIIEHIPKFAIFRFGNGNQEECFSLLKWLREEFSTVSPLVISQERQYLFRSIKLGARCFLDQWNVDMLESAMAEVLANGSALKQDQSNALSRQVRTYVTISRPDNAWKSLTPREKSILHLKKKNKTHQEIALELGISQKTLQNQISALLKKCGSNNLENAAEKFPFFFFEREGFEIA